ncbi:hypothetical protein SDC9_102120 [bioreactor metagenome]|uniref:Uncharacterized protein n=1 Tax=bioreactor metagenome TaxID=1076179 RepID=A0A645AQZ0_9ZZZZ
MPQLNDCNADCGTYDNSHKADNHIGRCSLFEVFKKNRTRDKANGCDKSDQPEIAQEGRHFKSVMSEHQCNKEHAGGAERKPFNADCAERISERCDEEKQDKRIHYVHSQNT